MTRYIKLVVHTRPMNDHECLSE